LKLAENVQLDTKVLPPVAKTPRFHEPVNRQLSMKYWLPGAPLPIAVGPLVPAKVQSDMFHTQFFQTDVIMLAELNLDWLMLIRTPV
jgi:hypothetical protein